MNERDRNREIEVDKRRQTAMMIMCESAKYFVFVPNQENLFFSNI